MTSQKLNGYQVRTERTKAQLLEAAEEVFSREGFEAAQMDSIAKAAGRSKGAIYAHYKSKDELFLALFRHRTNCQTKKVYDQILRCKTREEALTTLKKELIELAKDRRWILLVIEAKLYALRHPEMREQWLEAYHRMRFKGETFKDERQRTLALLFGDVPPRRLKESLARIVSFGPLANGLVLESEFEPELLTKKRLEEILDQVADSLLHL